MRSLFKKNDGSSSAASILPSSSNPLMAALAKATPNTNAPLQQQDMLFLLGASVREAPAMAACWAERLRSVGKQADAMLKMLTVLHRMQLHSPAFAATLLSSSVHGKSLEAQLDELEGHYRGGGRNAFIRGYLGYLRLRLQAPEWAAAAATAAAAPGSGGSAQRRLALPQALGQLPEWQNLFDAAIDGFDAAGGVGVLTQEPLVLLLRDANQIFVVLNDLMSKYRAIRRRNSCSRFGAI